MLDTQMQWKWLLKRSFAGKYHRIESTLKYQQQQPVKRKKTTYTHIRIEIKGIAKSGLGTAATRFRMSTCKPNSRTLCTMLLSIQFCTKWKQFITFKSRHHLQFTVKIPFRFWCAPCLECHFLCSLSLEPRIYRINIIYTNVITKYKFD